jgi:peptidylglycine monooxygenase
MMTPGTSSPVRVLSLVLATVLLAWVDAFKETPLRMPGVKVSKAETYLCHKVKLDSTEPHYLVGYNPHGDMKTAHHIIIYGCQQPGSDEDVWNCGEMAGTDESYESAPVCASGNTILYAWGRNAPQLRLPDGVGFKVADDTGVNYLVLQVHYARPVTEPDYTGISINSTTEVQPKRAAVLLMVTGGKIEGHSEENFDTACEINEPVELHPIKFRTHAHIHGKVVSGWKVQHHEDGEDSWELIGKHDPMKPQMFYNVENPKMTIQQGDIIAARCYMKNDEDRTIYVGATGKDEMCNFYMMYYVDGDQILSDNSCFSPGPPNYYLEKQGGLTNVPEEQMTTL